MSNFVSYDNAEEILQEYADKIKEKDRTFHGTQAEWSALTTAEKAKYDFAAFTDDYDPSAITNPNLLDNPWFTINQRGKSSYISSGGQIYTVDRWGMGSNNVSCDVTNDIITLTHADNTNNGDLFQRVETSKFKDIVGKSITASIMLSDGSIYSQSGIMPTIESTNKTVVDFAIGNTGYKMSVVARTSNILVPIYCTVANATISIKAVKLELGSVSTLAMDTAPNYATELLKCQRYFVRLKPNVGNTVVGIGFAGTASDLRVPISLPCEMRTTPTLTKSSASHYKYTKTTAAEATTASDVLLWSINGTNAAIRLIGTYDVSGTYLVYVSSTTAFIDLSADL